MRWLKRLFQRGGWCGEPGNSLFRGEAISAVETALADDGAQLGIVIKAGKRTAYSTTH